MTAIPYILILAFFIVVEYIAILISSSQLKAIIHDYMQDRDIVYQRPPHPLKTFLVVQKMLFFAACLLTVCFSIYLTSHFEFHAGFILSVIVGFKILSFLKQRKERQSHRDTDWEMAKVFRDDYETFVASWKTNMIIEIATLSVGLIILSFNIFKV